MTINLDITYTEAQWRVFFESTSRRRVVQKGGRVGMTRGAAQAFIHLMLQSDTPKMFLWGDVTLGNIKKYYELYFLPLLNKIGKRGGKWSYHEQDKVLKVNKCVCHFRSADRPERWEGFGYHYIFLNEAGIILNKASIWEQSVHKMLLDHEDSVLIAAGVPKGINMFSEMIAWAKDEAKPQWEHFHFTTYDNPFISREEIDQFVQDSPEMARQEIFGEIMGEEDSAFAFFKADWIQACFDNWLHDAALPFFTLPDLSAAGGDPSRGRDECSLALKHGAYVPPLFVLHGDAAGDSIKVANAWSQRIRDAAGGKLPSQISIPIRIDYIGWGSGVHDLMKAKFPTVIGLTGGASVEKKDYNRLYKIRNERTWWLWNFRELINPDSPRYQRIAICPDPILKQQFCAMRYEVSNGVVSREDKQKTKDRLGGDSPDRAESVIYAFSDKGARGRYGVGK